MPTRRRSLLGGFGGAERRSGTVHPLGQAVAGGPPPSQSAGGAPDGGDERGKASTHSGPAEPNAVAHRLVAQSAAAIKGRPHRLGRYAAGSDRRHRPPGDLREFLLQAVGHDAFPCRCGPVKLARKALLPRGAPRRARCRCRASWARSAPSARGARAPGRARSGTLRRSGSRRPAQLTGGRPQAARPATEGPIRRRPPRPSLQATSTNRPNRREHLASEPSLSLHVQAPHHCCPSAY